MFKKITIPSLLFFITACAFNSSEIGKTKENFSDFFLCFPETDNAFNKLSFKEQGLLRKKIAEEKRSRKFDCSDFRNFKGVTGKSGNFQSEFKVYDCEKKRCSRNNCSALIKRKII